MKAEILMYQARLMALTCDLESMKAANQARLYRGESLAYSEDHFVRLGNDFNRIADSLAGLVNYE